MTRSEIAHRIYQTSHLTGQFTLRSGAIATEYFDKYQFETDPELLCELAAHLQPLIPDNTDVLAGLELGGVPLATMLSQLSGLPACFVRKEAKLMALANSPKVLIYLARICWLLKMWSLLAGRLFFPLGTFAIWARAFHRRYV